MRILAWPGRCLPDQMRYRLGLATAATAATAAATATTVTAGAAGEISCSIKSRQQRASRSVNDYLSESVMPDATRCMGLRDDE